MNPSDDKAKPSGDHSNCIVCHPEKDPAAKQIMELFEDKRRMDWLDKHDGAIKHEGYGDYAHYFGEDWCGSARVVIDKIIEAENVAQRSNPRDDPQASTR